MRGIATMISNQPAFQTQVFHHPWLTIADTKRSNLRIGATGILGSGVFSDIKSEIQALDAEIKSLDKDLVQSLPADLTTAPALHGFYANTWTPFIQAWNDFDADHTTKFGKTWKNMWMSAWHGVQEFRSRFIGLYTVAKGLPGVTVTSPDPTPVPKDPLDGGLDALQNVAGTLKIILYLVFAVGVGFLVVWGIRAVNYKGRGSVGAFK